MSRTVLPLVYSCSGCSSAAQMANSLALRLDREALAEMSCIAGVGGGIPVLLRRARTSQQRIVLDGCSLACAKACLDREGIPVELALDLSHFGVRRRHGTDPNPVEAEHIWHAVVLPAVHSLKKTDLSYPNHDGVRNELEPR